MIDYQYSYPMRVTGWMHSGKWTKREIDAVVNRGNTPMKKVARKIMRSLGSCYVMAKKHQAKTNLQ